MQQISLLRTVDRVVALGTLCALELRAEGSNAGYYLLTFNSSFPFFMAPSFCHSLWRHPSVLAESGMSQVSFIDLDLHTTFSNTRK